jgi:hypothetical protein
MTTTKTIKITLSERRPVTIALQDWPTIATAEAHDGKVFSQANTEWAIQVVEHADGRRIVYGWRQAGTGGQYAGWRGADGGYIVEAVDGKPDEAETVRAIRRVGGVIGRDDLAAECIGDLPAEAI